MRAIAKLKNGITTVRAMAHHPMLSYLVAKKKHKKAKFITHLTAKYNFKGGKKGDKIVFYWIDNTGESKTSSAKIR